MVQGVEEPSLALIRYSKLNSKSGNIDYTVFTYHNANSVDVIENSRRQAISVGDSLNWVVQTVWYIDPSDDTPKSMTISATIQQYTVQNVIHSKSYI